ncbi:UNCHARACTERIZED [Ceraceosorus bombacis]|uniref:UNCHARACTERIZED n=1 Tax=Ceraceosorus bombacis TaxID=401625 RepID=A0A0P1BKK1_9BASI|nr:UNCHARACTERIZED [Ceraceosorus bombacis]
MEAPLQAFTESGLASSRSRSSGGSSKYRGGKSKSSNVSDRLNTPGASSLPPRKKRKGGKSSTNVSFDEASRHEYLTGFRKRKQERIEKARANALKRAKEEAKAARKEAKEAKKKKAKENVKLERLALGLGSEEEEEENDEEDEGEVERERPIEVSTYETPDHQTSVTVSEWDPTADPAEEELRLARASQAASTPLAPATLSVSKLRTVDELPASSRRLAKKSQSLLKKQEAARSRSGSARRGNGKKGCLTAQEAAAASISALVDESPHQNAEETTFTDPILGGGGSKPFLAGKHRAQQSYSTAADRKAQNEKLKERRKRHMEERKEKEKRILQNGGRAAIALRKRGTGKMGKGGKGKDLRKKKTPRD